jgi:uncharacterized membrane protein YidH (DUF202 family)
MYLVKKDVLTDILSKNNITTNTVNGMYDNYILNNNNNNKYSKKLANPLYLDDHFNTLINVSYYLVTFVITAGIVKSHVNQKLLNKIILLIIIIVSLVIIFLYICLWDYTIEDMHKTLEYKTRIFIEIIALSITLYLIILFRA